MSVDKIRRLIEGYELAYRSELKRQMSLSPGVHEVLPYFLKGANETTAMLGREGVVVIHRDALNDSFQFVHRPDQTVDEVLREQGIGELRKSEHEPPEAVRMSGPTWIMKWGEERPASKEFGWKDVEVIPKSDIEGRTEDAGRSQAELDVQTFANARLMGLPQGQVAETRDRVIAELEAAISGLEELIQADPIEGRIQMYLGLKRNQILLEPNMVPPVRTEVKIGEKRADFVIELPPGKRYVLVEIERPKHALFTREDRVTKEVTHAQQQAEDWINWIKEYPHEIREALPGIREPQGWVIIGRRSSMTASQQRVLERRNARLNDVTIMTYDDLLDRAKQHLENLRGL